MSKAARHISLAIFMGAAILLTSSLTGCNGSPAEYKTVNVKSELCSYSFEYSSFYKIDGPVTEINREVPFTFLYLNGPPRYLKTEVIDPASGKIKTVTGETGSAAIDVSVYDESKSRTASQTAQEWADKKLTGMAEAWKNFKLLERSTVTVSGIEAELVAYLSDMLLPIPVEDGKNLEYTRSVYFIYKGLFWVIEANSYQDITDQVKADFDHIIQTFKILN